MTYTHVVFEDLEGREAVVKKDNIHLGRGPAVFRLIVLNTGKVLDISEETYYRLRQELTGVAPPGKDPNPWKENVPDVVRTSG